MARVCGIEITSEKMAQIAKQLLAAHLCILFVAVAGGALSIISGITMSSGVEDLQEKTHTVAMTDSNAMTRLAGNFLLAIIPIGLLVIACHSIQSNDRCCMKCLCITDGVGTGLQLCGAVLTITVVSGLDSLREQAEQVDCNAYRIRAYGDMSQQDCRDTKEILLSIIGVANILLILSALLSFFLMAVCCWATSKASEGYTALTQGEVFVGLPVQAKAPVCQVVGTPVRQPEEKDLAV